MLISLRGPQEEQAAALEGIISSLTEELQKIREDAHSVQSCLTESVPAAGAHTHAHTHTHCIELLH